MIEAELTADDLDELGLTADEAEKFTAAFAAATAPPVVQLSTWLAELDLADSLEKFEAEGFTTLPEIVEAELTEDDLKELGLGMKARKLITIELAKLQEAAVAVRHSASHSPSLLSPDADTTLWQLYADLESVFTGVGDYGRDEECHDASNSDG